MLHISYKSLEALQTLAAAAACEVGLTLKLGSLPASVARSKPKICIPISSITKSGGSAIDQRSDYVTHSAAASRLLASVSQKKDIIPRSDPQKLALCDEVIDFCTSKLSQSVSCIFV